MKAWKLYDVNDIRYEEVPIPKLKQGEVLIKVKAAGICGSDIPRIFSTGAHKMPLIPGHEFSGEVTDIASDVESRWLNKRVGIFPLIPCMRCECCKKKMYEMCEDYNYLGSRRDGGFAEYVAVPEWNLIELPENVSFEQGAMLEPMAVAIHAMKKITIEANDNIAVYGAGTIGILMALCIKAYGYREPYVYVKHEFQRDVLLREGFSQSQICINSQMDEKKWTNIVTEGHGMDCIYECVGKNESYSACLELAAPKAKVCLIGNPYGDMKLDRKVYWNILRKQLMIVGTWNSSFKTDCSDDWNDAIRMMNEKRVCPEKLISHHYSISNLATGFELMNAKKECYIKEMGLFFSPTRF